MNMAPEIINILEQNTLISVSFSWTKLRKNHYHSQQHIPSIYLINDVTPASLPPLSRGGGTLWTRCSPQPPFRYFLSHHWDEIKTYLRTHSSSYLYIGIALMLATCISCVAGLSDNRSGHSSTSREVVTPHSTNPKISRTMLCRGIATK